jgi:hypothetical protein
MILIGDMIKCCKKNLQGVVIAAKKANGGPLCKTFHEAFMVYYILTNNGEVEGPLFHGEISPI